MLQNFHKPCPYPATPKLTCPAAGIGDDREVPPRQPAGQHVAAYDTHDCHLQRRAWHQRAAAAATDACQRFGLAPRQLALLLLHLALQPPHLACLPPRLPLQLPLVLLQLRLLLGQQLLLQHVGLAGHRGAVQLHLCRQHHVLSVIPARGPGVPGMLGGDAVLGAGLAGQQLWEQGTNFAAPRSSKPSTAPCTRQGTHALHAALVPAPNALHAVLGVQAGVGRVGGEEQWLHAQRLFKRAAAIGQEGGGSGVAATQQLLQA